MIGYFIQTILKQFQNQPSGTIDFILSGIIGGIIVPVVLHILQERRLVGRRIAHEVTTIEPHPPHPVHGSMHRIKCKLWNDRHEPIEPRHFHRPITFTFGNKAQVTDAKIAHTHPLGIATHHPPLSIGGNSTTLAPILLNKRYSITLEFLVARADIENIQIDLLISGNHPVDRTKERKELVRWAKKCRKALLLLVVLWALAFIMQLIAPQFSFMHPIFLTLAFFISFLGTLSVICYLRAIIPR